MPLTYRFSSSKKCTKICQCFGHTTFSNPLTHKSPPYFFSAIFTIQVLLSLTRVLGSTQLALQRKRRGRMETISITWALEVISTLTWTEQSMRFMEQADCSFKQVTGCLRCLTKWPDILQLVIPKKISWQNILLLCCLILQYLLL